MSAPTAAAWRTALPGSLRIPTVNADCYGQAKQRLCELVSRLATEGVSRLPSEAELSVALGVSRATLRSALQSLQQEGRIRRLHGRGTFINRHAVGIGANLAEAGAFVDLLAQNGHRPTMRIAVQRVVTLDGPTATALEVAEGEDALRVERVFHAGTRPAVHTVDHFPVRLLEGANTARAAELDATRSTFEFVRRHCGRPVCYSVAEVRAVLPPPPVRTCLELPEAHPVLRLRHTHLEADEQPVAVTVAHVNDEYLRFSVVRTHLDR